MADWKAGSPIEPREPARQAGEGGAALAVAAPDDEEVPAATNVEPAEPREPAEPAVAPPTESTQMSAEGDGMGGAHGPDAGQWPTIGHPLSARAGGDGLVARRDEAREAMEWGVDKIRPGVAADVSWPRSRPRGCRRTARGRSRAPQVDERAR